MKRDVKLWIAVLVAPGIWFAGFLANFAIVPWTCSPDWKAALWTVTFISLLVEAAAGLFGWRLWRNAGVEPPGESGGTVAHERSLALAAVLLSGLFFVVTIAQALPNLILRGCA